MPPPLVPILSFLNVTKPGKETVSRGFSQDSTQIIKSYDDIIRCSSSFFIEIFRSNKVFLFEILDFYCDS